MVMHSKHELYKLSIKPRYTYSFYYILCQHHTIPHMLYTHSSITKCTLNYSMYVGRTVQNTHVSWCLRLQNFANTVFIHTQVPLWLYPIIIHNNAQLNYYNGRFLVRIVPTAFVRNAEKKITNWILQKMQSTRIKQSYTKNIFAKNSIT